MDETQLVEGFWYEPVSLLRAGQQLEIPPGTPMRYNSFFKGFGGVRLHEFHYKIEDQEFFAQLTSEQIRMLKKSSYKGG